MRASLLLSLLTACAPEDLPSGLDLTRPLGPDEALAGVIVDPKALTGGLAAEARPGDVLLRNDRARFVIQAAGRASGGLVPFGGGVLDADLVRDDGSADADLVVDGLTALDVGWFARATAVRVVDDGQASGQAVVEVDAEDGPFTYLGAAFEDPDRSPPRGLTLTTTYTLNAGSPLLHLSTTVTTAAPVEVRPGDVLQSFPGITSVWVPGVGRAATPREAVDATFLVHDELGLTLGLLADDADASARPDPTLDLLNLIVSYSSLFEPRATLTPEAPRVWSRWLGVGPDPAALTDAWLAGRHVPTRRATVGVTDGSDPVAGARVTVLVDDLPFTLAVTDAEGQASADVPADATVRFVADGAGSRLVDDLPPGSADPAPLAAAMPRARALDAVRAGGPGPAHARGYGRAEGPEGEPLALTRPALLTISAPDADAFQARLRRVDGAVPDDALGLPAPDGLAALAHARHGRVQVPVEPGVYDVLVWAGPRFERHQQTVNLAPGEELTLQADDLVRVVDVPGWWHADPHVHAAPSFDGKLSPTDRALVCAGTGVELWFASEHDVAVDHRPLLAALDLEGVVHAVPTVEVTPWLRGHLNVFPVDADPDARLGGAWPWWEVPVSSTTAYAEAVLGHHGDVVVQVNHPFSPGLPSLAGWSEDGVARPDFWWEGFDALEVIVPGEDPRGQDLYVDLTRRGVLTAATGSTDSHGHLDNANGLLATWIYAPDAPDLATLTDAQVVAAVRARATVASNGPLLTLDPPPGSLLVGPSSLTVTAHTPSWIPVERLTLLRDGVVFDVQVGPGPVTFSLPGDADASYVVVADADTPMGEPAGRPAWAVASAVLVDADGDGWTPPYPPL